MLRNKLKVLFATMSFSLLSCASADQVYPTGWPALVDNVGCSDIVGSYANRGEIADREAAKTYTPILSSLLLGTVNDRIKADDADIVDITNHDSALYVRALRGSELLASMQYPEKNLICKDGWLTTQIDSGMVGEMGVYYGKTSNALHSASDGSLVVKRISSGTGLAMFVVPVSGSSTTYMRFPRRQ